MTTDISCSGIPASEIQHAWPLVQELLENLTKRDDYVEELTPADMYESIRERNMQCWIIHRRDEVFAVALTQILTFPSGLRILALPYLAGKRGGMKEWVHLKDGILKDFAREHGCKFIRVYGREGWKKIIKPARVRVVLDIEV